MTPINPSYLTDDLAAQIAEEVMLAEVRREVKSRLTLDVWRGLLKAAEDDQEADTEAADAAATAMLDKLYKAIEPYERKFGKFIQSIWDEEERIILANLKKLKKAYRVSKDADDVVDNILYPQDVFINRVSNETEAQFEAVMMSEGQRVSDLYDLDIAFDVDSLEAQKWLKAYTMKFASELERVSQEKLREVLLMGLKEGQTIGEMIHAVREVFGNWTAYRLERIIRSEIIRASNYGAKMLYRASGVVKKIIWIATQDRRCCDFCAELDGKVIGIEESFAPLGGELTARMRDEHGNIIYGEDGKARWHTPMKVTYTEIEAPPAHSLCRCAIAPEFD
jgi:SPP1 gp7 family putative phage head morphogenesis protein